MSSLHKMSDSTYVREATDDERAASILSAGRDQSGSGRIVADGMTCFVLYDPTDVDWIVTYLDKQEAAKAKKAKAWRKLLAAVESLNMERSYCDRSHSPYWTFNADERRALLSAVRQVKGEA